MIANRSTASRLEEVDASDADLDLDSFGPIGLVVLQPTSFCNLDCDYCYLPDRHLKERLSLDLIEPIFKRVFTSRFLGQGFTICWHAGEPLAVPISYYESAFERIRKVEQQFKTTDCLFNHSIQTNGTLIGPAWCKFLKQHSVHVGVSIDGPAFLHDAHRKTRAGKDSHALAMRGIRYLQEHEVDWNVIAVITEDSLDYPEELFHFFVENGIMDVGFNMEETEGVNQCSSLQKHEIEDRYRAFIDRFWDLTTQTNGEFKLREFESICSLIYYDERLVNTDMNNPFAIVSVDRLGNFSTFDPELLSVKTQPYGDFVLGNVLTDTLESVCTTQKFQQIYRDMKSGVGRCRQTCEYFGICGGGAGSNKFWENGSFDSTETRACKLRIQSIADLVLTKLESSLGIDARS
ncbi:arylsulfatase regulator (Fe-S oxidoreductase) [Rubidibacter lacunae KORDI 51-2]|uniref:Arylsulfatase regulator (Fe-S oxidoreductase) n=1 Tax=Rubidibacter lacunae KORDI 51-2 TaxID=582515 RepID=U5DGM8_9CHRO|nr:cyclophane-forming radical SAM/SPASM peptide maturase GrrM/OscB [Rubidibacter lacunae]ERN40437.1 arylsulfatase regulator (Fe-S oxidoreductase) [Rubidibacter lacunae KORDI 51-2]